MRYTFRTLAASAIVLFGLILAPTAASAEDCGSQPGSNCDRFPECGPSNDGQIVWGHVYEYRCSHDEQGYYWGKTGRAYV